MSGTKGRPDAGTGAFDNALRFAGGPWSDGAGTPAGAAR